MTENNEAPYNSLAFLPGEAEMTWLNDSGLSSATEAIIRRTCAKNFTYEWEYELVEGKVNRLIAWKGKSRKGASVLIPLSQNDKENIQKFMDTLQPEKKTNKLHYKENIQKIMDTPLQPEKKTNKLQCLCTAPIGPGDDIFIVEHKPSKKRFSVCKDCVKFFG